MTDDDKMLVTCDGCIDGNDDYGTREELVTAGWLITDDLHLCPMCNAG